MYFGLVLVAAVVAFIISVEHSTHDAPVLAGSPSEAAIALLRSRLARGEITFEEYERVAAVLRA